MDEKNFTTQEVEKIMSDEGNLPYPMNMAMSCAWILGNLKGVNLNIFNLQNKSSLCDYTVVAYATNHRQAQAMSLEIEKQMKKRGKKVYSIEGSREADWTLVDLGDVIIHILLETARESYLLEDLWSDCEKVEIPSEYYFTNETEDIATKSKGYF